MEVIFQLSAKLDATATAAISNKAPRLNFNDIKKFLTIEA